MSNNVSIRHSSHTKGKSFMDRILEYESVVIFGGFGCAILGIIVLTGIFQSGPTQRDSVLFNAAGAMFMALGFIYLIFKYMGNQVVILGNQIDIGMVIYIAIVLFVIFVLGN